MLWAGRSGLQGFVTGPMPSSPVSQLDVALNKPSCVPWQLSYSACCVVATISSFKTIFSKGRQKDLIFHSFKNMFYIKSSALLSPPAIIEATNKRRPDFDEPLRENVVTDSLLTTAGHVGQNHVSLNRHELKGRLFIKCTAVRDILSQYHAQIDPKNDRQAIYLRTVWSLHTSSPCVSRLVTGGEKVWRPF